MKIFIILALLLAFICAASSERVLLTSGGVAPSEWLRTQAAPFHGRIHFFLALTQRNLAELDRLFWAVSDPDSDEYQQFKSTAEIQALVSPPASERQVVIDWLVSEGVDREAILSYGDSLEVETTVAVASQLFSTDFHVYTHRVSGQRIIRSLGEMSVPVEIHERMDLITGLIGFPIPHLAAHKRPVDQIVENDAIIPQSIWSLYGLPTNQTVNVTDTGISQGVIEWEGESFSQQDLIWFAGNSSFDGVPDYPTSQIVGPNNPKQPGGESTLDVDMITGTSPSNTNWFWLEPGFDWLYGFTVHFLNTTQVPDISSISYSWYEGDQCENGIGGSECQALKVNTTGYVKRVNTEWQKIGLRGQTIVISSGDSGAHTRFDGMCQNAHLLAEFPPSSPYVTSVGATQVQNETFFGTDVAPACRKRTQGQLTCVKSGIEVAVDVRRAYFTSGGGFSNISMQPEYQKAAVSAYLSQTAVPLPPSSMYNRMGRAWPDVAAVGHNGYTVDGGYEQLSGGTSQSAPIFAGVLSVLATEFKKLTGASFGFINPLLYKMAAEAPMAFNDITSGDNICTEDGCAKSCKGWITAKGWDPVTGLGTPNYPNMLQYITKLAEKVVARREAKAMRAGKGVYGAAL